MNVKLKLETTQYCYIYSNYIVEKIKERKYIFPNENATRKIISISEKSW